MTLTVIMPTYNGSRFLRPQIESILAQTDPDFELLAMDDGSTDDTTSIVDEYARRDLRVRRLPSTGNLGQRGRLRQLTAAATGEYLAIADQDDIWHPERNARLLAAIGDRAMAFGRSQLIDEEGRDLGRSILEAFELQADIGPLEALFQPLVSAHAAVIRRSWMDVAAYHGTLEFDRAQGLDALFSTGLRYVDDAVVFHRMHDANQHNTNVLDTGKGHRLISRQQARLCFRFVSSDRLSFYVLMDQMGRSAALPRRVAGVFRKLAGACHNAWYYPSDRIAARPGRLERLLHEELDPFAASPADLAAFRRLTASLTRPQFGWTNLKRLPAKYRDA